MIDLNFRYSAYIRKDDFVEVIVHVNDARVGYMMFTKNEFNHFKNCELNKGFVKEIRCDSNT